MKIATAALNQTPLDWNRNADNIRCAIDWARKNETMVVCLPELCIPGVGCGPYFKRPGVVEKSLDIFFELLPELKGMIATLGLPIEYKGILFNTACLIVDGKPFGFQCRTSFVDSKLHELGWFRPWMRNQHAEFELNGENYKLGDLSFEFKLNEERDFHVAVEIGEPDWNSPKQPAAAERQKLDLLLNPSASRFSLEKHARRLQYAREATEKFDYVHVFSNYVGNESGPEIYDGGSFVAEKGKIVAETPRFSYHDAQGTVAILNRESPEDIAAQQPVREEELSHAVPLGMLDYLRKSGAKGFALSLSGGADSTSIAVFVALGVRFAWTELGRDAFCEQFGFVPGIADVQTPQDAVGRFLTCFYQGTKNSGETTRNAAKTVAEELGADFFELDIDSIVDDYVRMISNALGRELTWETDDIALQNIQARARVPSAWLIANVRNALLLATGNRSEATLGYTTMDGDTAGCLAPIGGIDKAFLRQWLNWMESTGPKIDGRRVSMPFLSAVNSQIPTAELRPPERNQTDEEDMMPYPVLNRIEQLGIAQRKSQSEIFETLREEFKEYSDEDFIFWIGRFFRRWRQNIWKRKRYAMSFHVDDSSISSEDIGRFPTLSGPDFQ